MFARKFPWGKVTVALVVGAAIGAATALLITPMNGPKMQKKLRAAMDDGVENVEKMVKKVVNA